MKTDEFNELFDVFASNPWAFLKRDGLPETRKLYYNFFKDVKYKIFKEVLGNLVKTQKMIPSVATVRAEIEAVEFAQPQPKVIIPSFDQKRSDRIKQMITEAREIINTTTGPEKMAKLKKCGESLVLQQRIGGKWNDAYMPYNQ